MYINRGRFGEFVTSIIEAENERKKEQAEKEDDLKLWLIYVHTTMEESFLTWKDKVLHGGNKRKKGTDADLTDDGIKAIIDDLFPAKQ